MIRKFVSKEKINFREFAEKIQPAIVSNFNYDIIREDTKNFVYYINNFQTVIELCGFSQLRIFGKENKNVYDTIHSLEKITKIEMNEIKE